MSFPDVAEAFWGLTDALRFLVVTGQIADFEYVENVGNGGFGAGGFGLGSFGGSEDAEGSFEGTLEPISPRRLIIKPEGQRTWKWWVLWTTKRMNLGDRVVDTDGRRYRVMAESDWTGAGYHEYELREGFDDPAAS